MNKVVIYILIISIMSIQITMAQNSTNEKFDIDPIVEIRTLSNVINKSSDGIVELYMNNPSVNNKNLIVVLRATYPSGIHMYGQGFGAASAAGLPYAKFELPPESIRTIYIYFKSERSGNFTVQFSGEYWPEDNKDLLKHIQLMPSFIVEEPSPDPGDYVPTNSQQLDDIMNITKKSDIMNITKKSYGFEIIISMIILLIARFSNRHL